MMNAKMFIEQFDQLIDRIYRFQDTHESFGDIKNKIYEFLDRNYDVYLKSSSEEREKIRELVKKHHVGSKSLNMLDLFLIGYIQTAAKNIKSTGDKTWLLRGLVVSAIENSLRDQRDNTFSLAYLYVMAEEKNLNPRPEFQAIAELSSNELSSAGTLSMSELMQDVPDIAHKTYNDWIKYR
jgi:hypothetical protein